MVEEARGFLGRWARRKTDALQGTPLDEPVVPVKTGAVPGTAGEVAPSASAEVAPVAAPSSENTAADAANLPEVPEKPALSLDDVKLLTKDSDFKPFMTSDVGAEVRNAAMKKLFADPHFNVMDGLDIYIDDYSLSDPIPESMLRQMASAKFLKLFDDEEDEDGKVAEEGEVGEKGATVAAEEDAAPRENANIADAQSVAQSSENPDPSGQNLISSTHSSQVAPMPDAAASPPDHAHSHLRLQPDHAAPAPDLGRGT
jgi:hypothetical protein